MKKSNLIITKRTNFDLLEIAKEFKYHEKLPSKEIAKRIEKELSKEHLELAGVALTDNYIVKVEPGVLADEEYILKPDDSILWNDTFSWVKYDEIVWIYTEVSSGNPVSNLSGGFIGSVLFGRTLLRGSASSYMPIFAVYPKDESRALIVCDERRFPSCRIRVVDGRIKTPSDDFNTVANEILEKSPDDCLFGNSQENQEAYYDIVGKKLPNSDPKAYEEDDLL